MKRKYFDNQGLQERQRTEGGVELASLGSLGGRAVVRCLSPLASADIRPDEKLVDRLKERGIGMASQWSQRSQNDNFDFKTIGDVMPEDGDYVLVDFRALSKTIVPGHWLDWTKDNVLEKSVELLRGATVYPNHNFSDINGWLGSVSNVAWDAAGKNTGGVPGINAQYKIDALMNPRIARGLMMDPPAIHSTSMTVLFEFDYSHPDMAADDRWKFFSNLGEEIDGEICRLIVTNVVEYWEASLVFQGADRLAKMQPKESLESFESPESLESQEAAGDPPPNSNEEKKTVKLSKERKTSLGIEFDGDEVPDEQVFEAIDALAVKAAAVPENLDELNAQAEAGKKFIDLQRDEVTRLAKVAELGADADGDLDPVVADDITGASFERLTQLKGYYEKKIGDKFPAGGRSSLEDPAAVDAAGGVEKTVGKKLPKVSVH